MHSRMKFALAKKRYMDGGMSRTAIAEEIDIPLCTLVDWIGRFGWVKERLRLRADINEAVVEDCRREIMGNLKPVISDHLSQARQIRDRAMQLLNITGTDATARESEADRVMKVSRTIKNAGDMEARVLGLDRSSAISAPDIHATLIMNHPQFLLPGSSEPQTAIDVESEEIAEIPVEGRGAEDVPTPAFGPRCPF